LQSASAIEFVKKDLAEFSNTMQSDTATAAETVKSNMNVSSSFFLLFQQFHFISQSSCWHINLFYTERDFLQHNSASAATERVKRGMSSFLDGLTRVLTIPPDDDEDQVEGVTNSGSQLLFDRAKVRLHLFIPLLILVMILCYSCDYT
jgi:hypothetical protein